MSVRPDRSSCELATVTNVVSLHAYRHARPKGGDREARRPQLQVDWPATILLSLIGAVAVVFYALAIVGACYLLGWLG